MNRRSFLVQTGAGALVASGLPLRAPTAWGPGHPAAPRPLIMDAMGELRAEYTDALVRDMLGSGLNAITVTLCDPKPVGADAMQAAVDGLLEYDRMIAARPQFFRKATTVADVERARREGTLAVFYLYQNTVQFGTDLDRVDMFYSLGLRSAQLTYNDTNAAGSGCRAQGRLTDFGRRLIDRMNRVGMLLDLSHVNMETMADAIAASRLPAIISHTGCQSVHRHVRNTTDENLRALANAGGVVGICQIRPFLTTKKTDNLDAYVNHLDHAVKVAGVEHVCIGSDRDHRVIAMTPEYIAELKREEGAQVVDDELPLFLEALNGPRRMEVVWAALQKKGYTSRDIERIMGGNLNRLYREVIG